MDARYFLFSKTTLLRALRLPDGVTTFDMVLSMVQV
jgi:hypothetical protein